jgi:HlyD family type I secretion membrane fusion protein
MTIEEQNQSNVLGIKTPLVIGLMIVFVFFGGLGLWGALAPLESAAIATGSVSLESKRRTIQHLEGGIIEQILVKEGDVVAKDEILIRLDETGSRATLDRLNAQFWAARALEARLVAERDNKDSILQFQTEIEVKSDQNFKKARSGQETIFRARRESTINRIELQKHRVAQLREEIKGLQGQIRYGVIRKKLTLSEIKNLSGLVKKKIARRKPLIILKGRLAEIEGELSRLKAEIAKARQGIGAAHTKISEINSENLNRVVNELRSIQSEVFDLRQRIKASKDVLKRTIIRSPIAGTIFNLQAHTRGGVIKSGMPLLEILPSDEKLIIEANINPVDIDVVHPGLKALVNLSAFSGRNSKPLKGLVTFVSADRFVNNRTGLAHYLALIELKNNPGETLQGIKLYPGMPAEVMIVTGARTALEYLLQPISLSFNRAFREQ